MTLAFTTTRRSLGSLVAGPSRLPLTLPHASRRCMATESNQDVDAASDSTSYPFSGAVTFPNPEPLPSPLPRRLTSPKRGQAVVHHVNESLLKTYDPQDLRNTLFSRDHKDRVRSGSVLSVVSYNNASKKSTSVFSGVLMGIRRRGVDTAFTLRNVVNRTGVEMSFKVHSPMIKEIQVIKNADGSRGGLKDLGRAKVNYLRDKPQAMSQIAAALKQK